jgi:hypothetical protein
MRAHAMPWRPILVALAALAIVAACAVAAIDGADPADAPIAEAPRTPPPPVAPPTAPPVTAAAPTRTAAPPARAADPEEALTERLRATVDEQPQAALAVADQADAAFPDGRRADERSWLRMRALVNLGEIGKARTLAGEFFERHPESPYARSVWRLTGMSPRRIGPPS